MLIQFSVDDAKLITVALLSRWIHFKSMLSNWYFFQFFFVPWSTIQYTKAYDRSRHD